ncbi:hypothetical protein ACSX1A_03050 [Pontibacter sp. MBLB2868]|uniref:hypothetical protein n=1 Tax=Pontibacter sp. MBLB2868 TaxID=3451555 RepID=UPI003F74C55E
MKAIYFISVLLLSVTFMSCDGDDGPKPNLNPLSGTVPPPETDTVNPVVSITLPTANDSLLLIDAIQVIADLSDNIRLDSVRVILTGPDGGRQVLSDAQIRGGVRDYKLNVVHQIPKYAATEDYTVIVEAKDYGKNVAKDSVTFVLYASDINSATFARPFSYGLYNKYFTEPLEKLGYNYWDMGYSFNDDLFSFIMFLMVNTDNEFSISEAEWNRFIVDFGVKNQVWTTWDENSDGNLNEAEFHDGLISLNLFNEWDENQDSSVYFDEMAAGIFSRWDTNNDKMLSKEEYLEKFYTYLYRE